MVKADTKALLYPDHPKADQLNLFRRIAELMKVHPHLTLSSIADGISEKGGRFHRAYLYRLKDGNLSSPTVESIVRWLEATYDPNIRETIKNRQLADIERLSKAITSFFPFPPTHRLKDVIDRVEDETLQFPRLLLRSPAADSRTFYPVSYLERNFKELFAEGNFTVESSDFSFFIGYRSLLLLRPQSTTSFFVLDIPLTELYEPESHKSHIRATFEGTLELIANHGFLDSRDILTRQRASHHIGMKFARDSDDLKTMSELGEEFRFMSIPFPRLAPEAHNAVFNLDMASKRELMAAHNALYKFPVLMTGYYSTSPSSLERLGYPYSTLDSIYFAKDEDIFRNPSRHFLRSDNIDKTKLERLYNKYIEWSC